MTDRQQFEKRLREMTADQLYELCCTLIRSKAETGEAHQQQTMAWAECDRRGRNDLWRQARDQVLQERADRHRANHESLMELKAQMAARRASS